MANKSIIGGSRIGCRSYKWVQPVKKVGVDILKSGGENRKKVGVKCKPSDLLVSISRKARKIKQIFSGPIMGIWPTIGASH